MVSAFSMAGTFFTIAVSLLFPVALFVIFRKKYSISVKTVVAGALTWLVFSQILEKLLHLAVLGSTDIKSSPLLFALYGALAAGIFEEVGRYVTCSLFLKGHTDWKDGMAFGIGHGGLEAILIGVLSGVQFVVFSAMLNAGTFDTLSAKMPVATLAQVKALLLAMTPVTAALSGIERLFAIALHLAFSLIVFYGIREKKIRYLFVAIAAHTLVDMLPGLYQAKIITNVYAIEAVLCLLSVAAVVFSAKMKNRFTETAIAPVSVKS